MNVNTQVITKKIARSLGQFSVISVSPTEKPDLSCPLCAKQIEGHFAVFDCDHYSCTECLDTHADAWVADTTDSDAKVSASADTVFICPICCHEVKNIEYK
jgi:hypothetical protein